MASLPKEPHKRSLSTEEMIEGLFADDDSENGADVETDSSDLSCDSDSSDEEIIEDEIVELEEETEHVAPVRKTCRTRGGKAASVGGLARSQKETRELALEGIWKEQDAAPTIPPFTAESKVHATLPDSPTPLNFLDIYFDESFYNLLVTQTNLYARQFMETHENLPRYSRNTQWKDVTVNEMKRFLAIYFLTGIIKKPELSQYWSTNPLLKTPIFGEMMSRNRFQTVLEFLHFNDNRNYDPNDPNRDRTFKVRPLVENLVQKFKTASTPSQNASIDEELMLWKGRLQFKQYITNKRLVLSISVHVNPQDTCGTPLFI